MKLQNFAKKVTKELNPTVDFSNLENELTQLENVCNEKGYILKFTNKSSAFNTWYQITVLKKSKEIFGLGFYYGEGLNFKNLNQVTIQNWLQGGKIGFDENEMVNSIQQFINLIQQN
ncbi:hypothetical protein D3C81_333820 [compost metagenome]